MRGNPNARSSHHHCQTCIIISYCSLQKDYLLRIENSGLHNTFETGVSWWGGNFSGQWKSWYRVPHMVVENILLKFFFNISLLTVIFPNLKSSKAFQRPYEPCTLVTQTSILNEAFASFVKWLMWHTDMCQCIIVSNLVHAYRLSRNKCTHI